MKEQFSMNREGHMMTPPETVYDMTMAFPHEIEEMKAHYNGITRAISAGRALLAKDLTGLPLEQATQVSSALGKLRFAYGQYVEAMSPAISALAEMEKAARQANDAIEAASAIRKTGTGRRPRRWFH